MHPGSNDERRGSCLVPTSLGAHPASSSVGKLGRRGRRVAGRGVDYVVHQPAPPAGHNPPTRGRRRRLPARTSCVLCYAHGATVPSWGWPTLRRGGVRCIGIPPYPPSCCHSADPEARSQMDGRTGQPPRRHEGGPIKDPVPRQAQQAYGEPCGGWLPPHSAIHRDDARAQRGPRRRRQRRQDHGRQHAAERRLTRVRERQRQR